jgi:hypothetical protein
LVGQVLRRWLSIPTPTQPWTLMVGLRNAERRPGERNGQPGTRHDARVVIGRSAKPLYIGSNPIRASGDSQPHNKRFNAGRVG